MRATILVVALAFAAAGCGNDEKPPPKSSSSASSAAPAPKTPKAPEFKSDPSGNLCLACNLRTDGPKCKKCGAVLKAEMPAAAPKTGSGEVGKSAVAPLFACPKEGCTFTDARKGTCLKHADTEMKVQWFSCAKCSVNEPVAGKCSKCGSDLARTLK